MHQLQNTLPIGSIIVERYQVEALLGKGGFGAVYLVRDLRVRQNVFALKEVINPDQRELRHFTLEVELLKRTDHPSLPRVYRAFDDPPQNRAYMLMDYIEGSNLEQLRRKRSGQRFPLSEVFTLVGSIVEAVTYLHAQQPPIIHRDIKPSNIIAPTSGERTVLVDLGIAKELDQDATTTAIRHASPGYGAPEQYGSGTNIRTDVYGLGATIYTLLTGSIPTDAFFRLTQHLSTYSDPLIPIKQLMPDTPKHISAAIERALALENIERFASVEDFWQALQSGAVPRSISTPATRSVNYVPSNEIGMMHLSGADRTLPSSRPRSRGKWAAALLLLLIALGMGFASALLLFPGLYGQQTRSLIPTLGIHMATAHAATSIPSPQVTPIPTPTSPPSPTLPSLAPAYIGMIHDNNGGIDTSMSLDFIIQHQQNIQGDFTVNAPLSGNGPFTGTVTANSFIQFIVHSSDPSARAPLYFSGHIQKNGNINGSYCSLDAKGHCNSNVGGYGTWFVQPGNSGP